MSTFAKGKKILDLGWADVPNPFLEGNITGFDLEKKEKPKNYTKCIVGNFNRIKKHFKTGSFDTVIAGEFIEHLENPVDFFKKCNYLLKKKGVLIFSTPTPYYYKTIIGNWIFPKGKLGGGHIQTFIPRILNNIADLTGFKMVTIERANSNLQFLNWQIIYVYKKIENL